MSEYTNAQKEYMEEEDFKRKVDDLNQDELPTANIMVAGITGTGKSTLLNAVFGKKMAETGKGRPVTEQIDEYQSTESPIRIWDTVGLELDSQKTKKSINAIKQTIAEKADSKDQFDRIHAIWYCINSGSSRYQGAELDFIKSLHSIGVPFIIVLTQCIGAPEEIDSFEKQIREINDSMGMDDVDIVQVCAQDFKLRGFTIETFGLDSLVNITLERLPDFIKGGFVAAQRVCKGQKRALCEDVIFEYVDVAQKGFWDKVPIVNVFTTDSKISKMFVRIGKFYNTMLPEKEIQTTIQTLGGIDLENGFWGLISPVSKKYDQMVDNLFSQKQNQGYNVQVDKLEKGERVSRMLAYYGYNFLDAMEQLWEELTDEQLKDISLVLDRLTGILQRKFQGKGN
ncbi:MAG: GTPase domain-containing protein [Streptococcus sp.]|nr:GTPase domain-containing protein [Streptococcus sp.]